MEPLVSVIIPVYNTQRYLEEAVSSILNQKYKNLEVICVDDESTDSSPAILAGFAKKDSRVRVFRKKNGGGGSSARNFGLDRATGEYLYFFDSDDVASPSLIQKAVGRAVETGADVVAFNGFTFKNDDLSAKQFKDGYNRAVLNNIKTDTFSYRDFPARILELVNIVPWNKIVRRSLVADNSIRFDELSSTDDLTFSVLCMAYADKVAVVDDRLIYYRLGHSGTITSTMKNKLFNVKKALESAESQLRRLPYYDEIALSAANLYINNYSFIFANYTYDFESEQCREYYEFIHERFLQPDLCNIEKKQLNNAYTYAAYTAVKSHTYEQMLALRSRDITVSLTTYPGRIAYVHSVIENIARQTMKPARVLLWLAREQFPGGEESLPQSLLDCKSRGEVQIKWCADDLRSHKKYYYTMLEYPEDLIITVDDDLIYPDDMIHKLYQSYLAYPGCISAMRTHIVGVDRDSRTILDYSRWIKEFDRDILVPSTQLFATTGAGTLFPPHVLDERVFDKENIKNLCPLADDIWINLMALAKGTETVCVTGSFHLNYCAPQEDSLFWVNVNANKNEEQYEAVTAMLEKSLGSGYFYNIVTKSDNALDLSNPPALIDYAEHLRTVIRNLDKKLQKTYDEKSEINAKLQKTYAEKFERGVEIKKLRAQLAAAKKKKGFFARLKRFIKKTPLYSVLKKLR